MKAAVIAVIVQRYPTRLRTKVIDRLFWAWLSKVWAGWRNVLMLVQPSTVIAWQRSASPAPWGCLVATDTESSSKRIGDGAKVHYRARQQDRESKERERAHLQINARRGDSI